MRHKSAASMILFSILAANFAAAEPGPSKHHHAGFGARPDAHAPIGVMGEHMHPAGGWMLSYRYGRMHMAGNRVGTKSISTTDVFDVYGFAATPVDMDMEMHMFSLMGAPTDWLTGMLMIPYVRNTMDHRTAMGGSFRTDSDGIGDIKLSTLWRLYEDDMHHLHLNFGMSFPTGRIRARGLASTPMGPAVIILPFPMQIGSGTYDWLPGFTYVGHTAAFSWGAQATGTIRTGRNDAGWAASNIANVTAWGALPITRWLSASLRGDYKYWSNYRGDEANPPPPALIPTADPKLRGGHRIDLLGGLNFNVPLGNILGKHRIAIEFGGPVQQWLIGPQLETSWRLVVGWQKAF